MKLIINSTTLLLSLVALGSISPMAAQPALACSADYDVVPASQNSRLYRNESLGFSVNIPENYRTIARNDGRVEIVDPATFEFVQCVTRSYPRYGVITWSYAKAYIGSWPITNFTTSLREAMRSEEVSIPSDHRSFTFENGREIILIRGIDETAVGPQGEVVYNLYAYFRSPDGRRLVVISGRMNDDVFTRILGSITLE